MSDQHEQDTWDQDEVEIEDLGAPNRGLSRHLFTLGEKWHAIASLYVRFFTLLVALALVIAVLLPGASEINNRPPGASPTAPGASPPSTIYLIDCGTTINVNSLPNQTYVWEQVISTPAAQECNFLSHPGSQCPTPQQIQQLMSTLPPGQAAVWTCSVGTPLPASAGKNGRNR